MYLADVKVPHRNRHIKHDEQQELEQIPSYCMERGFVIRLWEAGFGRITSGDLTAVTSTCASENNSPLPLHEAGVATAGSCPGNPRIRGNESFSQSIFDIFLGSSSSSARNSVSHSGRLESILIHC